MARTKAAIGLAAAAALALAPAAGGAADRVQTHATINGRAAGSGTATHPITLDPSKPLALSVEMHNGGDRDLEVRTLRLSGRVMGLAFYQVDTQVDFVVPAGGDETRVFPVDLSGLGSQAIGLIPSTLEVFDAGHHDVSSTSMVVDVRGSWHSTYGWFGIILAVLTAGLFTRLMLRVAGQRLPANRMRRALEFLPVGLGLALVIVYLFGATRLLAPGATAWLPTLVVCAGGMFGIGYLSPAPDDPSDVDGDTDDLTEASAALTG